MAMANADLRAEARASGIPLWRVGEALAVSEPTMTRKLRRELPVAEKANIRAIIERLKAAASQEAAKS